MHAYLFSTVNGVFYIFLMYAMCVKPICIELVGVVFVVVGCVCLYFDGSAEREDGVKAELIDYAITLACSFCGALFFFFSHSVIKQVPMAILFVLMSIYGFILSVITAKALNSKIEIFSLDETWGCFGFVNSEWIVYCIFVWGLLSMYPGYYGYIIAMMFFPPQVSSSGLLFEPILAQIFGIAFKVDKLPGVLSYIGAVIDLIGIFLINKGDQKR